MEIRVLKYFLAVAQEENMTKAAETLHTSQPNLSRQIAELEDSVGKKLFETKQKSDTYRRRNVFKKAGKGNYRACRENGSRFDFI